MKLVIAIVRHHHHHTCSIYVSTCVNHFSSLFIIFNHVSQFCCFPEALNSLNLQKTSPNFTPRSARTSLFGWPPQACPSVSKAQTPAKSEEKCGETWENKYEKHWKNDEHIKTLINNNNHQQSPKRVASTWKCWKDLFPIYTAFSFIFSDSLAKHGQTHSNRLRRYKPPARFWKGCYPLLSHTSPELSSICLETVSGSLE